MGRRPIPLAASTRVPPRVLRLLRDNGSDVVQLVRELDFAPGSENAEELTLTPADFERLVRVAARELNDPLLALHLPERLDWGNYHMGELAAYTSPTLRQAFERVTRYASLFYAPLAFSCEEHGDEFVVVQRLRGGARSGRYGNEFGIASTLYHARRFTGVHLTPRAVRFTHAEPSEVELVCQYFGTSDVGFRRADNRLVFALDDADRPSLRHDARLLATASRLADDALERSPGGDDFKESVAGELRKRLGSGNTEAHAIARHFKVSQRTLQRRLEVQGATFSALLDQVRRDTAIAALCDSSVSIEDAARRCGFSDGATLSRAFKRWTGHSPAAYRRLYGSNSSSKRR